MWYRLTSCLGMVAQTGGEARGERTPLGTNRIWMRIHAHASMRQVDLMQLEQIAAGYQN